MKKLALFIFIISSALVFAACPDGMISYYKFDSISGPIVDSKGDNNGTVIGSLERGVTGVVGNAFRFDAGEGVNITDGGDFSFGLGKPFSVEFWVNTTEWWAIQTFNARAEQVNDRWIAGLNWFQLNSPDARTHRIITGNDGYNDSQWHHVVYTWDGTLNSNSITAYIDGQNNTDSFFFQSTGVSSIGNVSQTLLIGPHDKAGEQFSGRMDEVAIYNRVLTPLEVEQHYNLGLAGTGYCSLEQETIPEVKSSGTLQIFVILIVALLIGVIFLRKD